MTLSLSENEIFESVFLLKEISESRTRTGKPYLAMVLGNSGADFTARMWDMEMRSLPSLNQGDAVRAKGTAVLYQEQIQLKVDSISRETSDVDMRLLYPSSRYTEDQLRSEFNDLVKGLRDEKVLSLFNEMKKDNNFFGRFFTAPAAMAMHHARIGGLVEHTLGVARLALSVADQYPWLRRDLVLAGSLLHDVGKVHEYEISGSFEITASGRMLGHITIGVMMLDEWLNRAGVIGEGDFLDLKHILLSHHGKLEHGSPREPAIPEALVVHFADDLDAKLDMLRDASLGASGEGRDTAGAYVRGLRRFFFFGPDLEAAAREPEPSEDGDSDDQGSLF